MTQPDVYTDGPKLEKIDPRKLKLRELAAVEKTLGRKLASELETGDLGVDTMQGLLWVMLCRAAGVRISGKDIGPDAEALLEQAEEYELGQLEALFEDDDDGSPPADLAGPDPTLATPSGGDTSDVYSTDGSWNPEPSSSTSGV